MKFLIVFSAVVVSCLAQRSPYAGRLPIGFPIIEPPSSSVAPSADQLGDRFGEANATVETTTQRLPLEAAGDAELVKRLSKLPIDHQPFWLINWKALEEQRNNPQTYGQRPNPFLPNTVDKMQR